jgi:hypothetical protein
MAVIRGSAAERAPADELLYNMTIYPLQNFWEVFKAQFLQELLVMRISLSV